MFLLLLLKNNVLLIPGKTEFDSDEDAHIVGDCVKVLVTDFVTV